MNGPELIRVEGVTEAPFEELREVLARAIAAQGGGGAALAMVRGGRTIVDLVGGSYSTDTLQLVFSVSKSLTAIAAAHAVDSGTLDLDEPLAAFWPEFARPSTAAITARMVLSHRSGIASLDRELTFDELIGGVADEAVAAQEPYWEPGTRHGYHSFTFGPLMEGIFRRRLGTTVGSYLRAHVTGPRDLDIHLGLPDEVSSRVARVSFLPPAISESRAAFVAASGIPRGTTASLAAHMDVYNHPDFLRAGIPSSSGVADARSLARLFAATLDGSLLGAAGLAGLTTELARGTDAVLGVETAYSSGMQLPWPQLPWLSARSYGHEAAGGSYAFADPDAGIGVAWITDVHPRMGGASPAGLVLIDSIRHCLRSEDGGTQPRRDA